MLACIFPGQGSQSPGMGRELFARYPRECGIADEVLGYPVAELCAGVERARLADTAYAQPAIFFFSCLSYLERSRDPEFAPAFFLGHSLGLYAALYAAGSLDLQSALRIVAERGRLMSEVKGGAMLAVIGDDARDPYSILIENDAHDIDVANYNSPKQFVLSGREDRIDAIAKVLAARGNRCVRLAVSGAFHSRYMEPVRQRFVEFLLNIPLRAPQAVVVSSTSGERIREEHLVEELGFQLTRPVRWMQTILALCERQPGIRFEEVGPGRVLTGLDAQIRAADNGYAAQIPNGKYS
jgi:malonyl CoA-acyl carrier protein transacylase